MHKLSALNFTLGSKVLVCISGSLNHWPWINTTDFCSKCYAQGQEVLNIQGSWWIVWTPNLTEQRVKMAHQTGVCNVCADLANEEENKCCGKRSCVTSYEMFRNVVLDREVLNIAIHAQCDIRAEVADFKMNSYRKAAYRQYILWKYGKLGKGYRRACPSCVVRLSETNISCSWWRIYGIQNTLNSNSSSKVLIFRNFNNNKDCYITINFCWLILSIESLVSNSFIHTFISFI